MDCFEEDQFLLEHCKKMPTFLVGKYFIMMSNKATTLNPLNKCRHSSKFLFKTYRSITYLGPPAMNILS